MIRCVFLDRSAIHYRRKEPIASSVRRHEDEERRANQCAFRLKMQQVAGPCNVDKMNECSISELRVSLAPRING